MQNINQENEDFLQEKLGEVGSVQHEDDARMQPGSTMNLPMLNNEISELTKKHATFD
jgi:hypothetical protein